MMEVLSKRMRDLRTDSDMKQGEMGDSIGISQNMVSNYENGRNPPLEVILQYAKYFDVSVDYLFGLSNERKPASGALADSFAALSKLAGESAPTATDIAALLQSAIAYYRSGAPCGNAPLMAFNGFVAGLKNTLTAAVSNDGAALLDATNEAVIAALTLPKVMDEFYKTKG